MIINGSTTINPKSKVTINSKVIYTGSTIVETKSTVSMTAIAQRNADNIVIKSTSQVIVKSPIVQRQSSGIFIKRTASLRSDLIKVGKAYFRKTSLIGDVITGSSLEGGGIEYMKTNQNFTMAPGDYHELSIKINDEIEAPKDISGASLEWIMGSVNKTIGNGIIVDDPLLGRLRIILNAEDTISMSGKLPHQMRMIDAHNHPVTIFKGMATFQ
jgi:hypothetical protein